MVSANSQKVMVRTLGKPMVGIQTKRMRGTLMVGMQKSGDGTIMNNYDKLYAV